MINFQVVLQLHLCQASCAEDRAPEHSRPTESSTNLFLRLAENDGGSMTNQNKPFEVENYLGSVFLELDFYQFSVFYYYYYYCCYYDDDDDDDDDDNYD